MEGGWGGVGGILKHAEGMKNPRRLPFAQFSSASIDSINV